MGAARPHVEISAATLAGGDNNQDRFAYGDGWAFVLDGASSFAKTQPEHDGGWYAEGLKNALVHELTSSSGGATTSIVALAIAKASAAHEDPDTCPTSTIAMVRWSTETVELYVLGDSTAALIGARAEESVTDSRLATVAPEIRAEYRARLAEGHGFDARHRELLQQLQARQAAARNQPGGYWIAGANAEAAQYGLAMTRSGTTVDHAVLATDGAAAALRYGTLASWKAATLAEPAALLRHTHSVEATDVQGIRWPRSKVHDDKTSLVITFGHSREPHSRGR